MTFGIHHTCLTVSDMDKSLIFYRDGLGLDVVKDVDEQGERLSMETQMEGAHNRLVWLKTSMGNTLVELLQYIHPLGKAFPSDARCCDVGMPHISFLVENIDEMYEKLCGMGVTFTASPMDCDNSTFEGAKTAYCYDPDGIFVELFQIPVDTKTFY
ncbi:hypothetical protein HMPREF9469_00986 [ [[Clostridium] citroniae WAL-17108]|uniref:VOC domain-containing protein n=2 Tax=Enterocloster citroniae TaxID=358743 RepID=G5HEW3_9FIRM|nr:VOC family protein [Enterocloster citroniae]EHF00072.1 hypothetical protein HMPREF9469_00986 [ [[Clostridium] citroniae WAL-17108]MCC3383332.1 VOC family protein [Enterocloster citroniae]